MLLTGKLLEGLVAVPVGGGRARAGLEIDHSEPSGSGGPPPTGTHSGPVGRGGLCGMHSAQVR